MTIETKPLRELAQTCVVTAHSEEKGEILIGSLLLSLLDEIDRLRDENDALLNQLSKWPKMSVSKRKPELEDDDERTD